LVAVFIYDYNFTISCDDIMTKLWRCYDQLTTFRKLGPRDFKGEGDEDSAPAPSSFIANAYNEIYAFYTRKAAYWKKIINNRGALTAPPESATDASV